MFFGRSPQQKGPPISVAEVQKAAGLQSRVSRCLAVQRHVCGVPSWSTASRSSSARPPHQLRNVPPICCSFCRPRRPSSGSILWLPVSSTSPLIASRLPKLPMASHRRFALWHGSCTVPAWPTNCMDGKRVEQARPQASSSHPRRSSLVSRAGSTRHFGCFTRDVGRSAVQHQAPVPARRQP